jgi:hypothetical protein
MTDVSMLGNIPKLFMMNCYGITSLTGLGGSNNLEIEIRYRFPVVDFSPLRTLYRLILQNVEQTIPAQEICQVTHLVIRNCPQFLSTNALSSVKKSVELYHCDGLTSLEGLENITYLSIRRCENIQNFEGILGVHNQ